MFSKTADPTSAPPRPTTGGNASRSVLGADLKITGEVTSSGALELLGEIDGNLSADSLVIGAEGRISGSVNARSVEVRGKLDGKVTSEDFIVRAPAQVQAEITYSTVVIESGATIEGRFVRPKG